MGPWKDFVPTRKYTRVRRNEHHKEKEVYSEYLDKGRKIKFGTIDIIDIECLIQLNLKMMTEENFGELLKISEGKKERKKNISVNVT